MTAQAYLCIIPISSASSAQADHGGPIFKNVNKLGAKVTFINKPASWKILDVNII